MKLEELIEKLKKFKFTKAIYLFGSYALGKETKVSDIDICVIDDVKYKKEERNVVYDFSEPPFDVSLFSDLPLFIKLEVLKGKLIFVKDAKFLAKIKSKVIEESLDMVPLWEEGLKIREKNLKI